jgi:hypothetical protein
MFCSAAFSRKSACHVLIATVSHVLNSGTLVIRRAQCVGNDWKQLTILGSWKISLTVEMWIWKLENLFLN